MHILKESRQHHLSFPLFFRSTKHSVMRVQKLPLRVVVLTSLLLTWWSTTWVHSPQIRSLRGEKKPGISSLSIQAPWSRCSKRANPEKWSTFQPNRTPDKVWKHHPWLSGAMLLLNFRGVTFSVFFWAFFSQGTNTYPTE